MASEEGGGGGTGLRSFIVFLIIAVVVIALAGRGDGGLFGDQGATSTSRGGSGDDNTNLNTPEVLTEKEVTRELRSAYRDLDRLREDVRIAKLWGTRSPLEGMVTLRGSGVRSEDEDTEYVVLEARSQNEGPVDISGWLLESVVTEDGATIPFSARVVETGKVNKKTPTLLYPGERAIVVTGESPIGVSFHENICTGYLTQFQDFYPSLERSCPWPIDEMERFGKIDLDNDNCYEYVEDLPRCRLVVDEGEDADPRISRSCKQFIVNELTHNSCVGNHRLEPDFERGDWRIYLEYDDELWRSEREIIRLLDREGKTVDLIEY